MEIRNGVWSGKAHGSTEKKEIKWYWEGNEKKWVAGAVVLVT